MTKNVGSIDRVIRIILGIGALSLIFWVDSPLKWLGLIGLIFITTGIINFCPLYVPFHISTHKDKA